MLDTVRTLLTSQYEAALCTLNVCVTRCPDPMWNARVGNLTVDQVVFHTLFFADLYLQPSEDLDALKQQPFHLARAAAFGDYEEAEDRVQVMHYERPFIAEYVQHCRRKAGDVLARESAEVLSGPSGFSWRKCSRGELHVYNIRHIQHHAAQLSLRLRLDAKADIQWIGSGWRDV